MMVVISWERRRGVDHEIAVLGICQVVFAEEREEM